MITISYVNLLLTVLTLCAVAVAAAVVIGINRARVTMSRLDTTLLRLEALLPEVGRLSREAEETLRSVHELSQIAGEIRAAMRQASAVIMGAKAGLTALTRGRA